MLQLMIIAGLVSALAGLLIKYLLEHNSDEYRINWLEYGIGVVVGCFMLVPLTVYYTYTWAQASERVYNQYLNGWETAAVAVPIKCSRDGPCSWDYNCDPYIVMVSYSCGTEKQPRTCQRAETRYHDCPYVKVETNYYVQTTLGQVTIATHRFPVNADAHRWRASERIPADVIQNAGEGEPAVWAAVNRRITVGFPGPVTMRNSYDNYILASDRTILRQFTKQIADYSKAGLLPKLNTNVVFPYFADKMYFVGFRPQSGAQWQEELAYLNAHLGFTLQGDLHVVAVLADKVKDPTDYATALKAHWQDIDTYGRDSFAKNGILVVIGTDGLNVKWAKAATGMPVGNSALTVAIENHLKGIAFEPEILIGHLRRALPHAPVGAYFVKGAIADAVLGTTDKSTRFKRVSMSGKDGGVGFLYLARETPVPTSKQIGVLVLALIFSSVVWLAGAIIAPRDKYSHRRF